MELVARYVDVTTASTAAHGRKGLDPELETLETTISRTLMATPAGPHRVTLQINSTRATPRKALRASKHRPGALVLSWQQVNASTVFCNCECDCFPAAIGK